MFAMYSEATLTHASESESWFGMDKLSAASFHAFDVERFLTTAGLGRSVRRFKKGAGVFAQGDRCDSIFYLNEGSLKLTVVSSLGKEATIALLRPGDFLGEECVSTDQPCRSATATTLTDCVAMEISKVQMLRVLNEEHAMSVLFVAHLLARTSRIQADLVDQLFNSSEKRLARALLLLANFGKEGVQDNLVPEISQETLAAMIGCTRSRVNFFLNRFRRLGFIEYDDRIRVNRALLQVVLQE